MDNLYKKDKFLSNNKYNLNYKKSEDIINIIDKESILLTPMIEDKEKTQLILSNILDPNNYSINYSNNKKYNDDKFDFYYTNKDKGPGRGFGNLNISNDIRNCDQSRLNTKDYKKVQETKQLFDYQFQYLDKNFQDPNHIVMPIPRGGESTRNQTQLDINKYRMNNPNSMTFIYD